MVDRLIAAGRWLVAKRAPVLGVGPGLVAIQVAKPFVGHSGKPTPITRLPDYPITFDVVMICAECRWACSAARARAAPQPQSPREPAAASGQRVAVPGSRPAADHAARLRARSLSKLLRAVGNLGPAGWSSIMGRRRD